MQNLKLACATVVLLTLELGQLSPVMLAMMTPSSFVSQVDQTLPGAQ